jgi:hypothetical protein
LHALFCAALLLFALLRFFLLCGAVSAFAVRLLSLLNRYVTFEPDGGGWNNIRMGFELFCVFA